MTTTRTYDDTKWRLVPVEATSAMIDALDAPVDQISTEELWRYVLDAAPQPEPVDDERVIDMPNKSIEAFEKYCSDPTVQKAFAMIPGTLARDLARDSFMAGAKYALRRCDVEMHPKLTAAAVRAENEACAGDVEKASAPNYVNGRLVTNEQRTFIKHGMLIASQAIRARQEGK